MAYPIPYNNNWEYPRLTSRAFDENWEHVHHCQSQAPWNHQAHNRHQETARLEIETNTRP